MLRRRASAGASLAIGLARMIGVTLILGMTLGAMWPAGAAWAQDAARGRQIAEEQCARCHAIAARGRFKQIPPDFAAIARYRTADWIDAFVLAPHQPTIMPNVFLDILDPDDRDDVVAYIVSLDTGTDLTVGGE